MAFIAINYVKIELIDVILKGYGNKIECLEDLFYGEKCDKPCKELN